MSKIKVVLRVRPLSSREKEEGHVVVVGLEETSAFITDIRVPERPSADSRQRLRQFDFDHVFWLSHTGLEGASQSTVFTEMGPNLEKSILTGHNATILCYGQSGTGKTHSMLGTKADPGLIPRLCQSLWEKLKGQETRKSTFLFEVSFMEIYREKVRDLLVTRSEKVLKLREHPQLGPHVQGLTRIQINEEWEFLNLLWEGERRRATGTTGSNRRSSRSHAIWTLYLTSSIMSESEKGSGLVTRTNRVHLVDLAGSEKADLITTKNLLAEGKDINRSLVSLGNVISSLAEKASYIPYRDSTLTFLLKDSLGGNSSTSIIITASPASISHAQTLNSFRFAQRARLVENQPKINIFHQANESTGIYGGMSALEFRKDISRLASMIRSAQNNGGMFRGLAPRHSWNRLISAIENWNHNDRQQQDVVEKGVLKRAASQDTSLMAIRTASTSTSTMTNSLSESDVMVQTEAKDEDSVTTTSSSNISLPNSPLKIIGTEVFIPCSNTIKCLTWKQEEIHKLPKNPSDDSSSGSSDSFASPAASPISEAKINHLKYLLQVHYPTMHCVGAESRIGEKIHGSIASEVAQPIQLTPIEVTTNFENFPIVREKFPTLVGESQTDENEFDEFSIGESTGSESSCCRSSSITSTSSFDQPRNNFITSTPITASQSQYDKNIVQVPQFGFKIPKASEFTKSRPILITPLESTDEYEQDFFNEVLAINNFEFGRYRAIPKLLQQRRNSAEEEATCFSESGTCSSRSTASASSSSSYESLVVKPSSLANKVKVVENCTFDFSSVEDKLDEIDPVKTVPFEQHVARVCSIEQTYDDDDDLSKNKKATNCPQIPPPATLDCSTGTKFQKHFIHELHQMENIGKQIQSLKQLTQRHHIVKPYVDKIIQLQAMDHRQPDPKLDAEIEECSGWNVNIELARVQKDIVNLNKLLKSGGGVKKSENSSPTNSKTQSGASSSSDSYAKSSPKSGSCNSSSRSSNKTSSDFKSSSLNSSSLQLKQTKNGTNCQRKVFTTPPAQPPQSWNLQFPMSYAQQQMPMPMPVHEYYPNQQFPHSQVPAPVQHHHQFPNPFTQNANQQNYSPSTFQNFHSQAQNQLAQRWQPILPKTHDYLHRMSSGYATINDGGTDYGGDFNQNGRFSCGGGNVPNFHPNPSPSQMYHNNTAHQSNPTLLYPTNFPYQQAPFTSANYQHVPSNHTAAYDYQYDSMQFPQNCPQNQSQNTSSHFNQAMTRNENHCSKNPVQSPYNSAELLQQLKSIRKQIINR